ncbi:MAG: GrpB family protein [Candidatus Daviesbacteria bacterium]|nr:GrpB family protein [Candidatus Daviesbacteria bacterium]
MLTLHKYSNSFARIFQKEKQKLQRILGNQCMIEHIGSTAIPGTDGKGVIDITLVFNNKNEIDTAIKLLVKKGYHLSKKNIDRNDQVFFISSAGTRESILGDIHFHLTTKENKSYKNASVFRDYLIDHPTEKQQYIDLKYQILKMVNGNRIKYTKMKSEFIKKIINLAKK